jgi:hypothetical protein
MIMSPSDSARMRQIADWQLGHLTYGENLDPNRAGARSPCRAFYMLTPGIIHGQINDRHSDDCDAIPLDPRIK